MWTWLKCNSEALGAIASIATAIALVFAYFSLRNTEQAVEANLMYDVQKDARQISEELFGNEEIRTYVLATDAGESFPTPIVEQATGLLHRLVRFYASIERLQTYEYIEKTYWAHTQEDICDLLEYPNFRSFWEDTVMAQGAQFRESFKKIGQDC